MSSAVLTTFLEAVYIPERPNLLSNSADQLRIAVRAFDRWLGRPAEASDLTKQRIVEWMQCIASTCSSRTANSKRGAILSIWNAMAEHGLCPPPYRVPKLRQPQRIPVAWTLDQVNKIFEACANLPGEWEGVPVSLCWIMAILVFWDTAGRLQLVLRARVRDVLLDHGKLFVPAEHIKGRRADQLITLHPQTLAVIRLTLPSQRELLFPYPYHKRRLHIHFKQILRSAGLPDDRQHMFHCFRRTAESYAARERGVEWAAAAVGHSVQVAKQSYISPMIVPTKPELVEALPRPTIPDRPVLRLVR